MPADRDTCVAIPIVNGKGDIMNCGMYRGVKPLEHAMEVAGKVLEKSKNNCIDK